MKTNQIYLFTQSSTSTDDLSDMDLKIKLLNRIHSNKSNKTHTTHQQLCNTFYESISLDQDALDAQAAQSSFHKRSSRRIRSPVVIVQDDTPAMQPLDKANILIQKHSKPEWFPKKSRSAKRRTTWFDLFLKSDIDKDENHILGPSIYNNDVELEYHVSQLKAAVLSEAQWNSDEGDVSKPRSFERHMSKSTKPHPCFYNNDYTYLVDLNTKEKYTTSITKHYAARYYKEGIEDRIPERWSKEVRHYHFEALNDLRNKSVVRIVIKKKWGYGFLTSIVVRRSDDKEYEFSYADLPRLSVNDVEDMYLLQVQDKLHHLPFEFLKDFNNALLMFIRRTVIKNMVEDIQLRVESYQRSLNLTKPIMFLEGIDQRIPFTMTATHKGVVYLNHKFLMKLSEVKKFCDGTLVKIRENLIDMMSKNKL
ncbi:hypothetical protein Tco_1495484, partial [Tanacetum coccineum]